MKKILFVKTEEETWDSFAKDLVSSVTSLNAIELPKLSTVSLHSIVQSAIGKKHALKKYDQFAFGLGKYLIKYYPRCAI